jgi:fibrillarin-like pre-rRNA processing protein
MGNLRVWPPERSKLAALYYLGDAPQIRPTDHILYLGAAAGTTVSYLADYCGIIYAVEMAPEPLPRLLEKCRVKKNIMPIPADAFHPERYSMLVDEVDILYQDISQRNQVEIATRNLFFLRPGGFLILMLKTRSISGTDEPSETCRNAVENIQKSGLREVTVTWLNRFHRDHAAIVCEK